MKEQVTVTGKTGEIVILKSDLKRYEAQGYVVVGTKKKGKKKKDDK